MGKSRSFWFLQKHWISPANNWSQLLTGLHESGEAAQLGPAGACPDRRLPRALGSPVSLSGSQTGLPCRPVAFLELTGPGVTGSVGVGDREARLAERMGPPHSHAWLLQPAPPGDQGRLSPRCLKGVRCRQEQPRASTGASWGLTQSCRPAGPPWDPLCGAQWLWKILAVHRPDHTHGCPPGLPAEEADREAQQAPPLPAGWWWHRPLLLRASSRPCLPATTPHDPQNIHQGSSPVAAPWWTTASARSAGTGTGPGLGGQGRAVERLHAVGSASLGLACSPGSGASRSARWGASSSAQGAQTRIPATVGPWSE